MIVFELIRKDFVAIGITPNLRSQSYPLNGKVLMGLLVLILFFISNLMYTIYEANTFIEYTQSSYMCSLTITILLVLMITLLNVSKFFNLFDEFEHIANASKLTIYIWTFWFARKAIYFIQTNFSSKIFSFASTLQWNQSTCGKIEWNHHFCFNKINASMWLSTLGHLHLFQLFDHRFGECSLWIASAIMVKARINLLILH